MVPLAFSRDEYAARLAKVRTEMARRGIDLLIVNDIANQHYLTAYDGWSFYTPQCVLVTLEEEEPVWIGRAMDAAGGRLTAWMKRGNIVGFPEDYVQRTIAMPWTGSPSGSPTAAGASAASASSAMRISIRRRPMRG